MPCQCAQVLPGQTRCPVCGLNGIQQTEAAGIQNCSGCRRAFRCPGCLLGN
jgi:ribosomal protein L37AE/L43A